MAYDKWKTIEALKAETKSTWLHAAEVVNTIERSVPKNMVYPFAMMWARKGSGFDLSKASEISELVSEAKRLGVKGLDLKKVSVKWIGAQVLKAKKAKEAKKEAAAFDQANKIKQMVEGKHVKVMLDTETHLVVKLLTLEGSKYFGSSSKWCTTMHDSFHDYKTLFILIEKGKRGTEWVKTNRKWQYAPLGPDSEYDDYYLDHDDDGGDLNSAELFDSGNNEMLFDDYVCPRYDHRRADLKTCYELFGQALASQRKLKGHLLSSPMKLINSEASKDSILAMLGGVPEQFIINQCIKLLVADEHEELLDLIEYFDLNTAEFADKLHKADGRFHRVIDLQMPKWFIDKLIAKKSIDRLKMAIDREMLSDEDIVRAAIAIPQIASILNRKFIAKNPELRELVYKSSPDRFPLSKGPEKIPFDVQIDVLLTRTNNLASSIIDPDPRIVKHVRDLTKHLQAIRNKT